jgi:DNA-binding CsgD family transcriptional regulator
MRAAAEAQSIEQLGSEAFRDLAVALDAAPALMFEVRAGQSGPAPRALAGEHAPLFPEYLGSFMADDLPHNPAAFRDQPIRTPMQSEAYRRTRVYRDFYRANGIKDKLHMLVAGNCSFDPGAVAVSFIRIPRQPDFLARDLELARLAYPAFEACARRATQPSASEGILEALVHRAAPRALVALDKAGRVLWLSPRAEAVFQSGGRRVLPERLVGAARRLGTFVTEHEPDLERPPVFRVDVPMDHGRPRTAALSIARTSAGERFVVVELEETGSPPDAAALRERFGLTRAESAILALLASGLSNREIAGRLYICLDTVKRHVYHIFGKLDVSSRVQAALRVRREL